MSFFYRVLTQVPALVLATVVLLFWLCLPCSCSQCWGLLRGKTAVGLLHSSSRVAGLGAFTSVCCTHSVVSGVGGMNCSNQLMQGHFCAVQGRGVKCVPYAVHTGSFGRHCQEVEGYVTHTQHGPLHWRVLVGSVWGGVLLCQVQPVVAICGRTAFRLPLCLTAGVR